MPLGIFENIDGKESALRAGNATEFVLLYTLPRCALRLKDAFRGAYHSMHNMFTDSELIVQISN